MGTVHREHSRGLQHRCSKQCLTCNSQMSTWSQSLRHLENDATAPSNETLLHRSYVTAMVEYSVSH